MSVHVAAHACGNHATCVSYKFLSELSCTMIKNCTSIISMQVIRGIKQNFAKKIQKKPQKVGHHFT